MYQLHTHQDYVVMVLGQMHTPNNLRGRRRAYRYENSNLEKGRASASNDLTSFDVLIGVWCSFFCCVLLFFVAVSYLALTFGGGQFTLVETNSTNHNIIV